jgi:type IV pilus assembly protein PilN
VIRINLLPYREVRQRAQLIRDGTVAGAVLAGVLILLAGWYWLLQQEAQRQQQRVTYMQRQLAQLNQQASEVQRIKGLREDLVAKIEVIRELQSGRDRPVRILQTLGQAVPESVSLKRIQQEPDQLKLEGSARSNAAISSFMRRLEAAALFADPSLEVIRSQRGGKQPGKSFSLQVALVSDAEVREGAQGGSGPDGGE